MVSGRKWLIGEAVVNDAVTMVFILSRIARIVDQKKRRKTYIVIKGTRFFLTASSILAVLGHKIGNMNFGVRT